MKTKQDVFDIQNLMVGVYDNAYDNQSLKRMSIQELLQEIMTGGEYVDTIQTIRQLYKKYKLHNSAQAKSEADKIKTTLKSYTIAGCFNKIDYIDRRDGKVKQSSRLTNGFAEQSGIVVIDFDDVKINPVDFRNNISEDKYVFAAFISPSGLGVKVFTKVPITNDAKELKRRIASLQEYFIQKYENLDISGKDITRLCFTSYDPDMKINIDSEVYQGIKEEVERVTASFDVSQFPKMNDDEIYKEIIKQLQEKFNDVKGLVGQRHATMIIQSGQMWRWIHGCNLQVNEAIDIFAQVYADIFPDSEKRKRYEDAQNAMYWAEDKDYSFEPQHPFHNKPLKRKEFADLFDWFEPEKEYKVEYNDDYSDIKELFRADDTVFNESEVDQITVILRLITRRDSITKKMMGVYLKGIVDLINQFSNNDEENLQRMVNMVYYIIDADFNDKERSRIAKKILSALLSKDKQNKIELDMSIIDLINEHKVEFDFIDPPTDDDNNYTMYAQIKSHDGNNDFELPLTMRSGGVFGIIAPPATGKTNMVLNIATSFASGDAEYSGIRFSELAQARKMLVADFENDKEFTLRKYTHVVEKYLMVTAGDTDCIHKVNFVSLGSSVNKKEDFFKIIRSGMYSIAIIDSLSMLVNSVNDEQENRQFMAELKRICIANDMSVIITSHTNKSNTTSGAGWSAQVLDQSCDTLGILTTMKNDQDRSIIQLDMDDKIIPSDKKSTEKKMSKARHRGAGHYNLIMQWAWNPIGILERYIEEPQEIEADVPGEVQRVLREFFELEETERKQSFNAIHKLLKDKCKVTYIGNPKAKEFIDMFNEIGKLPEYTVTTQTKGHMHYKFLEYNGLKTYQTVQDSKLF